MNELERIEAAATRSYGSILGGSTALVGGALCVAHALLQAEIFNRALPVGEHVDPAAIRAWYGGRGHTVCVTPERRLLADRLAAAGYTAGRAWMKFERGTGPASPVATELEIVQTEDSDAVAAVLADGLPPEPGEDASFGQLVGAPGWRWFAAWAGDEPAAVGALFADGASAWLGVGVTRPAFRRRGAQGALLAARIAAATADGATTLATETGELRAGEPSSSYHNILRAGFREAYLRANWRAPGQPA